jgi:tRNA (cytidine/uridine-2'-O-)-methyltransferase
MTHKLMLMINIVLYKPDIPQNTAAIVRLSACLNLKIHIIEPCGFNLDDSRFKRVVMDYIKLSQIVRYSDFENFTEKNSKSRIILMTTKSKKIYHKFKFKKNDFLLFGRESAGVPEEIHKKIKDKLKVPLSGKARSLNVAMTVAIVASEALKQNNFFK